MNLVMLGAPGAGKGTNSKMLAKKYKIPHISTGDILRSNIAAGTDLGKKAKDYIDSGQLVPDKLVIDLIAGRIFEEDAARGFVLDGFPRNIPQARALDDLLKKNGLEIDYAINFSIKDEEIIDRMKNRRSCPKCGQVYHLINIPPKKEGICDRCGHALVMREDDNPQTIRERLNLYYEVTSPVIKYYYNNDKLIVIECSKKSIKTIFNELVEKIEGANGNKN